MPRRQKKSLFSSKIVISIFFSLIMVTSILAIIFGGNTTTEDTVDYGDFRFVRKADHWEVEVDKKVISVYNHPSMLEDIEVDPEIINRLRNTEMVYITSPTQGEQLEYFGLAAYEMSQVLEEFDVFPAAGISDNNTGYNVPLITCDSATATVPVITFEYTNESKVYLDSNCIKIDGVTGFDIVRIKDRLVLGFIGVM